MTRSDLIFRIHKLVRAIEASSALDELDLAAREILKLIAERSSEGIPTRSSDVILLSGLGTPPTIYGRLAQLEQAGWIKTAQDPNDGRAKLFVLTPRAEKTFRQMSKELTRLYSSTSDAAG